MRTVAFCTLGCKVNQYDTQAMREAFLREGYDEAPFAAAADVYVVNTCTVTGTGDGKSLRMIRQAAARNPSASIVACGCLAQRSPGELRLPGVQLVLGTQRRAEVVGLLERAQETGQTLIAVEPLPGAAFEELSVSAFEGHMRAVMKIQEGCDRQCAYCIIPSVRGPVRSRPLCGIADEAERLAQAGYREIVLTGIHLASFGRAEGYALTDALAAACMPESIVRVRLGSLEAMCIEDRFIRALQSLPKVCRHFHLSLQSGSDAVLRRMRRTYTAQRYAQAAAELRAAFPDMALTTDVMVGFPGETEEEHLQNLAFVRACGFARIHVFPFSPRAGTDAAAMPDQVPPEVKRRRAAEMSQAGEDAAAAFLDSLIGTHQAVLIEENVDGAGEGYTQSYARVRVPGSRPGALECVRILRRQGEQLVASL